MANLSAPPTPAALSQPSPVSPNALQGGGFTNASLYVGDLDVSVTDAQLYDLFGQIGPVVSVRVCKDQIRRMSLGYGYVNYQSQQEGKFRNLGVYVLIE